MHLLFKFPAETEGLGLGKPSLSKVTQLDCNYCTLTLIPISFVYFRRGSGGSFVTLATSYIFTEDLMTKYVLYIEHE